MNSICVWRGELFVSGFGGKAAAGPGRERPSWQTANNGRIFNITRNETLAEGIDQPHSLVEIGGKLAYCESQRMAVRTLGGEAGQILPGYSRGLCVADGKVFAATSVGRRISNSTGAVMNPGHAAPRAGAATVSRLSLDDFQIEATADFTHCGCEIYELLPAGGVESWPRIPETAWRDAALCELSARLDATRLWAARTNKTLTERGTELAGAESLLAEKTAEARESTSRLDDANREISQLREQASAFVASIGKVAAKQDEIAALANETRELLVMERLRRGIHRAIGKVSPPGARVLVVSRGDDDLVEIEGREGWHFPQDSDGAYAGHYPADAAEAIAHLEALRAKGAAFLVFPAPALWWLGHYGEFADHLRCRYREVASSEDLGRIFDLR